MSIKVLTVEDSVLIRRVLNDLIIEMDGVELVGTARNGAAALEKIQELKPDIITMDVEMPVMNGLEALRELRKTSRVPVIMLSSMNDEETTLKALEMGAQDFVQKPINIRETKALFRSELESHIKALSGNRSSKRKKNRIKKEHAAARPQAIEALVIGASTGGPKALVSLIQSLPEKADIPIFIVQHMPEGFTASFAKRLNTLSSIPVVEAIDGMPIEKGKIYLAPGGKHMVLESEFVRLLDTEKIHGVKPAVDPLFETAAEKYRNKLAGVVLTGMGRDGTTGCQKIQQEGGYIVAQNEESCVVFGMPKHAMESGVVDEMLSLEDISISIKEMVKV